MFRCFPASPEAVTYRAVLHGTASATSSELISQIEQWTAEGAGIIVQQILLEVDGSCTVAVSSLTDEECQPRNTDSVKSSSNTGGIIGGVLTVLILLVIVVITVVMVVSILFVKKHQTKSKSPQTSSKRYEVIALLLHCVMTVYVITVLQTSQLLTLPMRLSIPWTMSMKTLTIATNHRSMKLSNHQFPQLNSHQLVILS